jgi:acyl carrier protein
MQAKVREFVISAVRDMNYDVSQITGDTDLGPAGLDLESLALAELAVQVEDEFGVRFDSDDMETTALMTLDQFVAAVTLQLTGTAVDQV